MSDGTLQGKKAADAYAVSVVPADRASIAASQGGQDGALERNFSFLSALGMAFGLLNSWTAMSASLSVVLPSGGPVAMLWGLCVSFLGTLCMALSLAEICHIYPFQGGQYDWSYLLAPPGMRKGLSFFIGWVACAGWISLTAAGAAFCAQFCTGLITLWNVTYVARDWHIFLIYLAFTLGAFTLNTFAVRLLPLVDRTALVWSLVSVVVVVVTILATAAPDYQPASFVFGSWINETGWPSGVTFILGLLQSTLGLTGFDAIAHMVEEMPDPAVNAPRVIVIAVLLGAFTSWIFLLVLLFVLTDIDSVVGSSTGPLIQIYYQATSSRAGATGLVMFNLFAMAFATQAVMTVASRMCCAFARDRGFGHASSLLAWVSPKLHAPVWSLIFTSVWVTIFGLIYLGSSVVLNAILSSSLVFFQISYAAPIVLVLLQGRGVLDQPGLPLRSFALGRLGYVVNVIAVAFAFVTSIFFCFPPVIPVQSGSTMNYVVIVLAIVTIMAVVTWIVDGRRNFEGPRNVDKLLSKTNDTTAMEKVYQTKA